MSHMWHLQCYEVPIAFTFYLEKFSLESQVENYQLLVQSTSKSNLNEPNMDYSTKNLH